MKTRSLTRFSQMAIAAAVVLALANAMIFASSPGIAAVSGSAPVEDGSTQYGPPSFADLADRVRPAVVSIAVTGTASVDARAGMPGFGLPQFPEGSPFGDFFRHFGEQGQGAPEQGGKMERKFRAAGSGFFISADGYVVTNNHVVENAEAIEIVMQDGTRYDAAIKGLDPKTDLALLKVDAEESFPYVELGDSDRVRVGEWVVAVGNPFGLGDSVTAGIISARGRDINSGSYDDYFQIDAPINRGNSGGPLFDNRGRVVGVNTAIYSPSGGNVGIGFAIPSNLAREIVADLKIDGKVARGWLGVQIQSINDDIAESLGLDSTSGALVAGVEPGSPAERAGVLPGDVIVGFDGERLKGFKDLPKKVAVVEAGKKTLVEVERQGETLELTVEIGSMPGEDVKVALTDDSEIDDTPKLGVYLAELTNEARQRYRIGKETEGVLVAGVERGSPASAAGIDTGDVIKMVGQEVVKSPEDVIARVKQAAKDKKPSVLLMVEHAGKQRFVAVKFAQV